MSTKFGATDVHRKSGRSLRAASSACPPHRMRSTSAFKLDIPAARYWKLSHNESFRSYLAGLDGNVLTTLSSTTQTDENGQAYVTRVTKISAKVNPVPIAIRKIGGLGEEFFFIMTESFWPERIGREHKLTFSTEPPVLANRITVTGSHWVEPTGPSTCELCWELFVDVKMVGVGQTIARGVRDGSVEAQSKTAGRVISFLEQVGGCPDGNVRGQMSETHVARRRWHCALVTIMFMSRMNDDEEMIEEERAVDSPSTAMKDPNRVLAYGKSTPDLAYRRALSLRLGMRAKSSFHDENSMSTGVSPTRTSSSQSSRSNTLNPSQFAKLVMSAASASQRGQLGGFAACVMLGEYSDHRISSNEDEDTPDGAKSIMLVERIPHAKEPMHHELSTVSEGSGSVVGPTTTIDDLGSVLEFSHEPVAAPNKVEHAFSQKMQQRGLTGPTKPAPTREIVAKLSERYGS